MRALFWEAGLMLLGAYFLGAWLACLARRTFFAAQEEESTAVRASVAPAPAPVRRPDPAAPLGIPIQPAPAHAARFDRALTGQGAAATSAARAAPDQAGPPAVTPDPAVEAQRSAVAIAAFAKPVAFSEQGKQAPPAPARAVLEAAEPAAAGRASAAPAVLPVAASSGGPASVAAAVVVTRP